MEEQKEQMTKEALIEKLRNLEKLSEYDEEMAHIEADAALLLFINDSDISAAFGSINKWYA